MIQLLCNFIRYTNLHSIALATQTPASCLVKRFPIPCTMLWLARSMMAVRPTPKVAFWPKLRKERLVVVFKAPFSYNFSSLSYCSASKCSLLNSCIQWYRGVCVCGWMTVLQCSSQVYQMYEGVCVHVCVCVWEREKERERENDDLLRLKKLVLPIHMKLFRWRNSNIIASQIQTFLWSYYPSHKVYLNCFIVNKRVNSLRTRLIICLVHLGTEFGPR